jgi:glycine dehydrogenase subunit 1
VQVWVCCLALLQQFVLRCRRFDKTYDRLLEEKIVAGISLEPYYPELEHHYLFCVTETKSKADLDLLVKEIAS